MAIAAHKPTAKTTRIPETPTVKPDDYKSTLVDDNKIPLNSLISYVSGSPWEVTLYSQVLDKGQDVKDHDVDQSAVYQSYHKTVGLELRVSDPLTSSTNDNGYVTVSGSATVYPFVRPNLGDVIVADLGTGELGIYRIKDMPEAKSFNLETVYTINYELVARTNRKDPRYLDLENKVIRTYYFSKERLTQGLSPVVCEEDHHQLVTLKDQSALLTSYYFRTFFNKTTSTLVLPGQDYLLYDPFLTKFVMSIVDAGEAPEIAFIKILTVDSVDETTSWTLWDLLKTRNVKLFRSLIRKVGLVDKRQFSGNTYIDGIRFHKIDYVVLPLYPDLPQLVGVQTSKLTSFINLKDIRSAGYSILDLLVKDSVDTSMGDIYKVTYDDAYVLSNNFYNQSGGQSLFEKQVMSYLYNRPADAASLLTLAEGAYQWGKLEQFYYIPILLLLIRYSLTLY